MKTSTVPTLRDAHRMAPCLGGLLRWRLVVFLGKMLRLIKVLRLNEASAILLSHRPGNEPPVFHLY